MHRVLISDPLAQPGLDLLQDAGLDFDVRTNLPQAELIAVIAAYDALIIRSGTQVTAKLLPPLTVSESSPAPVSGWITSTSMQQHNAGSPSLMRPLAT